MLARPIRLAAILLAAGASSRMGEPKLLLPWGETSILGHLTNLWRQLQSTQVTVVCAPGQPALARELDRLGFPAEQRIINATPEHGMFTSIQCAARWPNWRPNLTHYAIILGDQPQVSAATLQALLYFVAAHPGRICQPTHRDRLRHPVVLPASVFPALGTASESNLKEFLAARAALIARCPLDDPALDLDLDTPFDYANALRSFPP